MFIVIDLGLGKIYVRNLSRFTHFYYIYSVCGLTAVLHLSIFD